MVPESDDFLAGVLKPARLTEVVDIGANPIDGDPPYKSMLEAGLCRVTGFEPQQEALEELNRLKGPLETYLPWAVGDGGSHLLYECHAPGMTSLLEPDAKLLSVFNDFDRLGEVTATRTLDTRRLDDIGELPGMDMLKIDVQGSELAVFRNGRTTLADAVLVQTEVSFMPLYKDQPLYWEIERELRGQGFVPHAFASIKRWPLAPYAHPEDDRRPVHQLLEADLVFVRDFVTESAISDEQLRHLALLAHHCYGSHDLVLRCLQSLATRGCLAGGEVDRYRERLFPGHATGGIQSLAGKPISFG